MPTSFNILRGNTVTIANKPLTEGLMTIDTDKKKVSVDWDSNGTLERIGFSSGDVTANSNESGSNDLEGLSVGKKGYKVLPIDSDLVLGENDITLSDIIDNKADIDDYGVDLIAKRVMTNLTAPTKNTDPYVNRKTPTAKTDIVDMHKIIGASVVWNQLASAILISGTSDGITFTNNNDGSVSISGKSTAQISRASYSTIDFKTNHIYFLKGGFNDTLTNYWLYANIYGHIADGKSQKISKSGTVIKLIDDYSAGLTIRVENDVEISGTQTAKPIVIDLTTMFGSTIADYVYSLETSQSGTGIAWLQSYGFFTEDYYAYQTNKIESVCVSEKKIYGENLIAEPSTYPISPITLRGLFGVNNGKLTVDGDEYESNGNVTRKYGIVDLGTLDWSMSLTGIYPKFTSSGIKGLIKPSASPSLLANAISSNYPQTNFNVAYYASTDKIFAIADQLSDARGNIIIVDSSYNTPEAFKTAMSDVYLVYELATPITETTTPFVEIQSDNASATGNPVTVNVEKGIMQNAVVTFTPIQDLHGYDKPWAGGSGKNKLPLNLANIKTLNRSGTWTGNKCVINGVTFEVFVNDTGEVIEINATGTATANATFIVYDDPTQTCPFNGYYLNGCQSGGSSSTYFLRLTDITTGSNNTYGSDTTINLSDTGKWRCQITVLNGYEIASSGLSFKPMIRLSTEADGTFAPYSNICPISGRTQTVVSVNGEDTTIQFGQIVYGGEVDVTNGGTSSTFAFHELDGTENNWEYYSVAQGSLFRIALNDKPRTPELINISPYCNSYNSVAQGNRANGTVSSSVNSYSVDFIDNRFTTLADWKLYLQNNHIQIAYLKAIPTTLTTPATSISLNKGNNTVTVDDNGTISFSYRMRDTFISTEEFVDYEVSQGSRDIAIPCGHDSDYYQCFDLPELPTDNNVYLLTCTVTNGEPNITWERS